MKEGREYEEEKERGGSERTRKPYASVLAFQTDSWESLSA